MKLNKRIIFFIVYWVIYYGVINQFIYESSIWQFVPDILVILLSIRMSKTKSKHDYRKVIGFTPSALFFIFLVIGTIGNMLQTTTVISWLWGLRVYVRYAMLFMCMYKAFDINDVIRTRKIMIFALFFNLAFMVVERLTTGLAGDMLGGTFDGGNSQCLAYLSTASYFVLAEFFQKRRPMLHVILLIAGFLYFAIIGEVKMVYPLLPIILYGIYVLVKKFTIMHIFVVILAFVLLIPSYKYAMSFYYGEEYIEKTFDANRMAEEVTGQGFGTFNRSTVYEYSTVYLTNTPETFIFGHGLGASLASFVFVSDFALANYKLGYQYFTSSYIIAETGWIGYMLFLLFHILILVNLYKLYIKYNYDQNMKYWLSIGLMSFAVQFILMWYGTCPVLYNYPVVILWAIITIAVSIRLKELNTPKLK